MTITKDVINDLLPLYEAGEASADTRRLVEEYLGAHPEASAGAAVSDALLKRAAVSRPEVERRETLERARVLLARRQWFFGLALGCTLMPFSIAGSGGTVTWFMLRDATGMAGIFVAAAVACWIGYFRVRSQLRVAGM